MRDFMQALLVLVVALPACRAAKRAPTVTKVQPDQAAPSEQAAPWLEVPAFSFPDQDGHTVSLADLAGHPWVADFIYTSCTTACPILSARTVALARQVPDPRVRFVSFSVDPEHDTAAALKSYVRRWHGDESRWRLLRPDAAGLKKLGSALELPVADKGDATDPIVHTSSFLLVDGRGRVQGMYDSRDDEEMKQLAIALRTLAGATKMVSNDTTAPDTGERLYASLGCQGCHALPSMGPPLAGLRGRQVQLAGGTAVVATEAYLRESIVNAPAKIVAGYGFTMPSYAWLTDAEISSLVTYLGSSSGSAAAASPRRLVVDPVCKMSISAGDDTLTIERGGRRYYFCSKACRARFVRDPQRYAGEHAVEGK
ncbi:MAG: SCO family protein [Polyangia bacterium]